MNTKELAAKLNGNEYRNEIDRVTKLAAKANGLVVVFGASDDLMEFRGAINDETGAYTGGNVLVDCNGILLDFSQVPINVDAMRDYFQREPNARKITAKWDSDVYSWTYETDIPHETFDVLEDGEPYCRGIVFRLEDAKGTRSHPPEIERLIEAAISYMRDGPAMNYMNLRAALDAVRPGWRETK